MQPSCSQRVGLLIFFAALWVTAADADQTLDPPVVVEPLVPGATEVLIAELDPNATLVTLYQTGGASWNVIPQSATLALIEVSPLSGNDELYATQTVAGVESEPSDTVTVASPPPTLIKPTAPGAIVAVIGDIHPTATLVTVQDIERAIILGAEAPTGAGTIALELDFATISCQTLAATQIIAGYESLFSETVNTGGDSTGSVVINEFRHDDPGSDDEEFIELYNADSLDINISGWRLRQGGPNGDSDAADYGILLDAILPAGGYYLLAPDALLPDQTINVSNFLRNDPAYLELVTACGEVVDTVAWARRGGSIAVTTEDAIWGDLYSYTPLHGETMARWRDGQDSNSNRKDFGVRRPTPGASNDSPVESDYHTTLDPLGSYSSHFFGQWRDALIIDPNQTGPIADGDDWNPYPVDRPPTGGNAITFWDPDGGSNHYHSESLFTGAAFDVWMYFDTTKLLAGETIFWTVGLCGAAVNDASNSDGGALAGQTGVLWEYRRTSSSNKLTLFDASAGGGRIAWDALGSITLTSSIYPPGWYRLGLSVDPNGAVVGLFDSQTFTGQADVGPIGSLHIVYDDENFNGQPQARYKPPMIAGDIDCDANGEIDLAEIALQGVDDCNTNYKPDTCEMLTTTLGDANFDGLIAGDDWLGFESCLTGPTPDLLTTCCAVLDRNADSAVDLIDVASQQLITQ